MHRVDNACITGNFWEIFGQLVVYSQVRVALLSSLDLYFLCTSTYFLQHLKHRRQKNMITKVNTRYASNITEITSKRKYWIEFKSIKQQSASFAPPWRITNSDQSAASSAACRCSKAISKSSRYVLGVGFISVQKNKTKKGSVSGSVSNITNAPIGKHQSDLIS